jgi:glycosyltransferase involved in cell wall biosynthesis
MREVYILSTDWFVNKKTAGARRVMKIAKSLALGNVSVFLTSYSNISSGTMECVKVDENIYDLRTTDHSECASFHMLKFLRSVHSFISSRKGDTVIYLYPTTFVLRDFIYLCYFKFLKKYRFFCEINELRVTNLFFKSTSKGFFSKMRVRVKNAIDYFLFSLNERQVPFYDGIVVISTALEKYFIKYTKQIIRIPILCDASATEFKISPPFYDGSLFRICFAGYIHSQKEGFDIFLEALQMVNETKNTELFMYGVLFDEDRKELESLARKLGLENKIHYLGNLDPGALPREFLKYHLLILPRPLSPQIHYGFSTKLSEYLTSGIPVLVTDVSDNALFIRDNFNGFIIPPGSSVIMRDKLLEIIDNYNTIASQLASNAIETAKKELDYRNFTGAFIDFFYKTN